LGFWLVLGEDLIENGVANGYFCVIET